MKEAYEKGEFEDYEITQLLAGIIFGGTVTIYDRFYPISDK